MYFTEYLSIMCNRGNLMARNAWYLGTFKYSGGT